MRKIRPEAFARMEKFAQQDMDPNSMDLMNHKHPHPSMPGGGYHPALPETAISVLRTLGLFGEDIYKAMYNGDVERAADRLYSLRYSLSIIDDVLEHMRATGGTEAEEPPPESVSGD